MPIKQIVIWKLREESQRNDSFIQNCKNKCPDGSDLPSGHFYLCCLHYSMGTIQAAQA